MEKRRICFIFSRFQSSNLTERSAASRIGCAESIFILACAPGASACVPRRRAPDAGTRPRDDGHFFAQQFHELLLANCVDRLDLRRPQMSERGDRFYPDLAIEFVGMHRFARTFDHGAASTVGPFLAALVAIKHPHRNVAICEGP